MTCPSLPERPAGDGSAPTLEIDLRGEVCPYTFLKARLALERMAPGAVVRVVVDSAVSARDVPRSLVGAGHAVLAVDGVAQQCWVITVRKELARPGADP